MEKAPARTPAAAPEDDATAPKTNVPKDD
jgi:hypothetical protein